MNDDKDTGLIKVSLAFAIDQHTIIKFTRNIQYAAAIFQKAFCLPGGDTNKQLLASGMLFYKTTSSIAS